MSATTHVFWVNENVANEFEAFLTAAGITPEVAAAKVKDKAGTEFSVNHEQTVEHTKSKKAAGSASDRV